MKSGKLEWFVYSTQQVKISSYNRQYPENPIIRLPLKFKELLEDKVTIIMGDISNMEFPGAFGKGFGCLKCQPGFTEYLQENARGYNLLMASRRNPDSLAFSRLLGSLQLNRDAAYCFLLNPLPAKQEGLSIYYFVDNNQKLIGHLGEKFGTDHGTTNYKAIPLKTTEGEMSPKRYVSLRIREFCSQRRDMQAIFNV